MGWFRGMKRKKFDFGEVHIPVNVSIPRIAISLETFYFRPPGQAETADGEARRRAKERYHVPDPGFCADTVQ